MRQRSPATMMELEPDSPACLGMVVLYARLKPRPRACQTLRANS